MALDTLVSKPTEITRTADVVVELYSQEWRSDQDVQDYANDLLISLRDTLPPSGHILHWQCTEDRSSDLLRPFDESLGALVGITRRSQVFDSGKTLNHTYDADYAVRRFLARYLPSSTLEYIARPLRALLVGSQIEGDFDRVREAISTLFDYMSLACPVRIVIENAQWADELLLSVVDSLKSPAEEADIRMFILRRDATEQVSPTPVSVPAVTQKLLKLCAFFGSEFRHSWLVECWPHIRANDHEDFSSAFRECLKLGVLRYCDALFASSTSAELLMQLKWVRRNDHEYFTAALSEQDRSLFTEAFRKIVFRGPLEQADPVATIRLKVKVFNILTRQCMSTGSTHGIEPSLMVRLGHFLWNRAFKSGAAAEAARRAEQTRWWWGNVSSPEASMEILECGGALLELYLPTRSEHRNVQFHNSTEDELDFSRRVVNAFALSASDKSRRHTASSDHPHTQPSCSAQQAARWFQRVRRVWKAELWDCNLGGSLLQAELLRGLADCCGNKPYNSQILEAAHVGAVTMFVTGEFSKCRTVAAPGVEYCETSKSVALPQGEHFGNHDGRCCCKLFSGLSDLVLSGRDTNDMIPRAVEFADIRCNQETQRIARTYSAISMLIQENYVGAHAACNDCENLEGADQWRLLTELVRDCAVSGISFTFRQQRPTAIDTLRGQRKVREYDTLWIAYQGLSVWNNIKEYEPARVLFEEAVRFGSSSGERAFVPIAYYLHGQVAAEAGVNTAIELLEKGCQEAESMSANLFVDMIRTYIVRLRDPSRQEDWHRTELG